MIFPCQVEREKFVSKTAILSFEILNFSGPNNILLILLQSFDIIKFFCRNITKESEINTSFHGECLICSTNLCQAGQIYRYLKKESDISFVYFHQLIYLDELTDIIRRKNTKNFVQEIYFHYFWSFFLSFFFLSLIPSLLLIMTKKVFWAFSIYVTYFLHILTCNWRLYLWDWNLTLFWMWGWGADGG